MGTLVPPWYKEKPTSKGGLLVAAFFFGASMAVAAVASTKAGRQSHRSWRRSQKASKYIAMIWAVIALCVIASLCSWLFLLGIIPPSIWYFLGMLFTWVVQIQCLMQILANRLSLIMYNPRKEWWLKVGLLLAISAINISVFCIWIPARLQINPTFIHINTVWDRVEKVLFAVIDVALNTYFMWLVKSKLVSGGLRQYNLVYKYNLAMVCVSLALDVLLIGLMSLPDDAVYVQVHPLMYLTKLNIEMNMAELLGKVVKRSNQERGGPNGSAPTTDLWRPCLGMSEFDREWLGSAKNIIMPPGGACGDGCGGGGGDPGGGAGGGQMHELNLEVLHGPNSGGEEEGSGSGTQGDLDKWQSKWGVDGERARVGSAHEAERKDSGTSGLEEV